MAAINGKLSAFGMHKGWAPVELVLLFVLLLFLPLPFFPPTSVAVLAHLRHEAFPSFAVHSSSLVRSCSFYYSLVRKLHAGCLVHSSFNMAPCHMQTRLEYLHRECAGKRNGSPLRRCHLSTLPCM